jgi:hypothetical protein
MAFHRATLKFMGARKHSIFKKFSRDGFIGFVGAEEKFVLFEF